MNQLEFPSDLVVQNLRELADRIESGKAEIRAGKFNVSRAAGVSVPTGWAVVVHLPMIDTPLDIEINAQPSVRSLSLSSKEQLVPQGGSSFSDQFGSV
jgi:hypothetical protein